MPANLITLPHFSISAASWSLNSAGVKIFGVVAFGQPPAEQPGELEGEAGPLRLTP